jgi:hypothetical protein
MVQTAVMRVRAATVRVRDQFVHERYGAPARQRYRAAASRDLVETLTSSGDRWVDFAQFVEATELACMLFADGDTSLARAIGAYGAEANMGVWRSLVYRVLSPKTVLDIASGLWSHHYQGGKLVALAEGKTGVRVRIEQFPAPHRVHCLSIEGWLKRTIELGRPRRVLVAKTACRLHGADACELLAEWE